MTLPKDIGMKIAVIALLCFCDTANLFFQLLCLSQYMPLGDEVASSNGGQGNSTTGICSGTWRQALELGFDQCLSLRTTLLLF